MAPARSPISLMEETAEAAGRIRSWGMKSKMPVRALACRCPNSSSLPSIICLPCSGSITLLFISSNLLCVADPPSAESIYCSFHAKGAGTLQSTGVERLGMGSNVNGSPCKRSQPAKSCGRAATFRRSSRWEIEKGQRVLTAFEQFLEESPSSDWPPQKRIVGVAFGAGRVKGGWIRLVERCLLAKPFG